MIRIVLTTATIITLAQAVWVHSGHAGKADAQTTRSDTFHGASGTGKTVTDPFASDGGLGGMRRGD